MKKQILMASLMALLSVSLFAKDKFAKLEKGCVYAIYKIEIRNDLDRDFYSQSLGCPESIDEPHTSGVGSGRSAVAKAMFKRYDFDTEYYAGTPVGEMSYTFISGKKGKATVKGINVYLFGEKFRILFPLAKDLKSDAEGKVADYNISFDEETKYVYLGTFVYDFVNGTYFPNLVEVRDEYEEAVAWVNEMAGKEVVLSRGEAE